MKLTIFSMSLIFTIIKPYIPEITLYNNKIIPINPSNTPKTAKTFSIVFFVLLLNNAIILFYISSFLFLSLLIPVRAFT
ncbi:MAG: hypothetical protein QT09_C0004G0013 [archaeon GW2011_AR18]|nr:MAG: hypothetical protein QT09_C0004G0013 [archaeon GW2011_AR18]